MMASASASLTSVGGGSLEAANGNLLPPITLEAQWYPSQMGIYKERDSAAELPHCEYCGRKQAKKDEPLCTGCGNVL